MLYLRLKSKAATGLFNLVIRAVVTIVASNPVAVTVVTRVIALITVLHGLLCSLIPLLIQSAK